MMSKAKEAQNHEHSSSSPPAASMASSGSPHHQSGVKSTTELSTLAKREQFAVSLRQKKRDDKIRAKRFLHQAELKLSSGTPASFDSWKSQPHLQVVFAFNQFLKVEGLPPMAAPWLELSMALKQISEGNEATVRKILVELTNRRDAFSKIMEQLIACLADVQRDESFEIICYGTKILQALSLFSRKEYIGIYNSLPEVTLQIISELTELALSQKEVFEIESKSTLLSLHGREKIFSNAYISAMAALSNFAQGMELVELCELSKINRKATIGHFFNLMADFAEAFPGIVLHDQGALADLAFLFTRALKEEARTPSPMGTPLFKGILLCKDFRRVLVKGATFAKLQDDGAMRAALQSVVNILDCGSYGFNCFANSFSPEDFHRLLNRDNLSLDRLQPIKKMFQVFTPNSILEGHIRAMFKGSFFMNEAVTAMLKSPDDTILKEEVVETITAALAASQFLELEKEEEPVSWILNYNLYFLIQKTSTSLVTQSHWRKLLQFLFQMIHRARDDELECLISDFYFIDNFIRTWYSLPTTAISREMASSFAGVFEKLLQVESFKTQFEDSSRLIPEFLSNFEALCEQRQWMNESDRIVIVRESLSTECD